MRSKQKKRFSTGYKLLLFAVMTFTIAALTGCTALAAACTACASKLTVAAAALSAAASVKTLSEKKEGEAAEADTATDEAAEITTQVLETEKDAAQ